MSDTGLSTLTATDLKDNFTVSDTLPRALTHAHAHSEGSLRCSKLQFNLDACSFSSHTLRCSLALEGARAKPPSRLLPAAEPVSSYPAVVLDVCDNVRRLWGPCPLPCKNIGVHNGSFEHIAIYQFLFTKSSNRLLTYYHVHS